VTRASRVIEINFARTDFRTLSAVRTGLLVLTGALAVVMVILVLTARSSRREAALAEHRVAELAASEAGLRPVMEERQQLVKNLNAMTGLLQARRFSWTRFLTRLEDVFPEGIALTKLDLHPGDLTATLEGYARSPEALSRLMIGLERSRSFKNPLLKRQSMDKGILSFDVIVVYNEASADRPAPVAVGKRGR
jgi:Tfp pilus assembly protein PilN